MPRRLRGYAWVVVGVGLAARALVLAWAAGRVPPTADGTFYHTFAARLAAGLGYTWAWPDGAVTYAAHYPVGYPALLGLAYRALGARAEVGMAVNAALGSLAGLAAFALLARATSRRLAFAGGLAVALHPALVGYTPALMTEGVNAALLLAACAVAAGGRPGRLVLAGLLLGVAVLVRPQSLVLAPVVGAVAARASLPRRLGRAALVTAVALAVCAPWTARNCVRMGSCALVSVNGGWNLLIGTQTASGAWEPVAVPPECREVWDEAAKDACFGAAARVRIAREPARFLAQVPAKLAVTFDYFGGGPWYLAQANPVAFPQEVKVALGALETVASRLALLLALAAVARAPGRRRGVRSALALPAALAAVGRHAWPAYLGLVALGALAGARAWARWPALVPASLAVVLSTAAVHATFFGAGRYGLVAAPFVTALAFFRPRRGGR